MASITIVAPGAPLNIPVGTPVVLQGNPGGATSYQWELLDIPEGSAANLTTPTAQNSGFTLDIEGTYLIRFTVDGIDVEQAIAAAQYVSPSLGLVRIPAAGETFEGDLTKGWARVVQKALRLAVIAEAIAVDSEKWAWKRSVRLASTGNIALNGAVPLVLDTVGVNAGDRVLIKDQADPVENGVYDYDDDGANYTLTRSADFDEDDEVEGSAVAVRDGVSFANSAFLQTNDAVTVGVTPMAFVQMSITALSALTDVDLTTQPPTANDLLMYNGALWVPQKNNVTAAAPTAADDSTQGYIVGSRWFDTSASPANEYVCVANTAAAAVWRQTTQALAIPTGSAQLIDVLGSKRLRWTVLGVDYEVELTT